MAQGKTVLFRSRSAKEAMESDPDIRAERDGAAVVDETTTTTTTRSKGEVPLNVVNFSHRPNAATRALVESIGGVAKLREFTSRFYELAFADPHLDQFIREHEAHHGERFAFWIAEKFGLGQPWTEERSRREIPRFKAHGHVLQGAHDRSSAHFAAWHSPKRDAETWGEHFKLDDCRVWMRLHFKAARDAGVLDTPFGNYYVRFIGHFVSVYERTAPQFARESARWSADPTNFQRYLDNGREMPDIQGLTLAQAVDQLPPRERGYTGSGAEVKLWPYEL